MELNEKLVELRRQKGLTQDELARELGVTRQAVSKWERGVIAPATVNLVALGRLYGVPLDELVNGDMEKASGGVAVAVEAEADPPVREKVPRKREWKAAAGAVLAACLLLVTVAAVITIWSAVSKEPEELKDEIIWLEDMEWEDIDPAEIIDDFEGRMMIP